MYKCPVVVPSCKGGGCWVCYECGQEGCIVTNLERGTTSRKEETSMKIGRCRHGGRDPGAVGREGL